MTPMLNFFSKSYIQGRELWRLKNKQTNKQKKKEKKRKKKKTFNMVMTLVNRFVFKLGMMITLANTKV